MRGRGHKVLVGHQRDQAGQGVVGKPSAERKDRDEVRDAVRCVEVDIFPPGGVLHDGEMDDRLRKVDPTVTSIQAADTRDACPSPVPNTRLGSLEVPLGC